MQGPDRNNANPNNQNNLFDGQQPGFMSAEQRLAEEKRKEEEMRLNIERVKSPVERLETIPMLRLDEGLCDSLKEEFMGMCVKISYVMLPRNDQFAVRLRNWDLWGPFFMIVLYAFFIDNSDQLLILFFSVFIGSFIVTFNVVALGGRVSFFQSFSILSYCIFPIFLATFIQRILLIFQIKNRTFTVIFISAAVLWSIISVSVFIGVNVPVNKRFVAVYPAALYYIFVGILLAFG